MVRARRQPEPQTRIRDSERSRNALLDSARVQFAEHGFAGARVNVIASEAGVNKQLIAYYFGGKQGLYDAVKERRRAVVDSDEDAQTSLADLASRYVRMFGEDPDLERIFLRETLDQSPESVAHDPDVTEVVELRRRQEAGQLDRDLDPAFLLLFLEAMTVAGTLFASEAKRLTGLDPRSREFRDRAAEQVGLIVRRLG